ncbi:hypothetical protein NPS34_00130 [Pseudomonas putida]|uniref:HTH cro/C1-type domain-containing protein n=1 Tax=Pseudomonas putida (strain ATCC 700007 / DSM 6899 / JCM 31910 / BCRC 17059 / LMG 24140 / F1) TaxID=351746 RepID=A5WAH7_PSEP1|nr:hypothetical protein [Pseudomonas putida]MDD1996460.1 hypothetical protein [Pseudomonas putida]HDS1787630.1 hypothetical protein [Pseudomonas putida]
MSNYSPVNIFKTQAKQHAREHDMKLSAAQEALARQAGFEHYHELVVVAQRNPTDPRLMLAAFGVRDFKEAIHEDDVFSELDQELEDLLSGPMAETNASEFTIGESEVESAAYDDATGVLRLGMSIDWEGKQDPDRVYYGRVFFLKADVDLIRRDGRWSLGEDGVSITGSETDADRDRRTEWEYMEHQQAAESEKHRPSISMAQALANELKISLEDAELLADAEVTANTSDDGMIYSYWVDVEPYAEGALRDDLLARFGTLEIELNVNFFDDIHPEM